MATQAIKVPDIGGAEGVEIIEITVKVGDVIALESSIVVLETDKASMEIPASAAGKVTAIKVKLGDKVSQGDLLIEVEVEGVSVTNNPVTASAATVPAPASGRVIAIPQGRRGVDAVRPASPRRPSCPTRRDAFRPHRRRASATRPWSPAPGAAHRGTSVSCEPPSHPSGCSRWPRQALEPCGQAGTQMPFPT